MDAAFNRDMSKLLKKYPNAVSLLVLESLVQRILNHMKKFAATKDAKHIEDIFDSIERVLTKKQNGIRTGLFDLYDDLYSDLIYASVSSNRSMIKHIEECEKQFITIMNTSLKDLEFGDSLYTKLVSVSMQLQRMVAETIALMNEGMNNKISKMVLKHAKRIDKIKYAINSKEEALNK